MANTFVTPKTVLMITHVIPVPPAAGNEMRILKFLHWMHDEGFRTIILFNQPSIEPAALEALRLCADFVYCLNDLDGSVDSKLVDPVLEPYALAHPIKKSLCPPNLVQLTRDICLKHAPDMVIAEYVFSSPCLDVVPVGTMKLIDAHDMFSRRDPAEALCCTTEEERRYLLKADVILAIQENEAEMFRALVPEREVITVGVDFPVSLPADGDSAIPGVVMIAGSDNKPNQEGLKDFCDHAWPLIRAQHQNAQLRVLGKISAGMKWMDASIQTVGWVEDISAEYHRAEVVINPTKVGTGLKIKTIEALSHGKAFVGTHNSVEGIPHIDPLPFISCDDWNSFAVAVNLLLSSPEARSRYQRRALDFSKDYLSREKVYGTLRRRFATIAPGS